MSDAKIKAVWTQTVPPFSIVRVNILTSDPVKLIWTFKYLKNVSYTTTVVNSHSLLKTELQVCQAPVDYSAFCIKQHSWQVMTYPLDQCVQYDLRNLSFPDRWWSVKEFISLYLTWPKPALCNLRIWYIRIWHESIFTLILLTSSFFFHYYFYFPVKCIKPLILSLQRCNNQPNCWVGISVVFFIPQTDFITVNVCEIPLTSVEIMVKQVVPKWTIFFSKNL